MSTKTSSEYGWLVISRSELAKLREHDYAGYDSDGTVWAMTLEPEGTTLWKGVEVVDD